MNAKVRAGLGLVPLVLSLASGACYVRGPGAVPLVIASTAVATAAIVSATRPPRPRVVYAPPPRPWYTWQPGYWTKQGDQWVWLEGQWVANPPGSTWTSTHWEQAPDGTWQLVQGHWGPAPPLPY
jgi:hypothetical protein